MKEKKLPERTCIVCRTKSGKAAFIRIVSGVDGIHPDPTGRADGRGAYVCRSSACIEALGKKKALDRSFKRNISEGVYQSLLEELRPYAEE